MKRILLFTLGFSLFAITTVTSQVKTGFKAGINFADISGLEFNNNGSAGAISTGKQLEDKRTSYFVGFLVDIPVTENLSFVPEFIFSQQGVNKESFRVDYLNLPLGLKFNLGKIYLNAGPQVGVKIWSPEQSNIFSNFEASVFGGLGYTFNSNIFVEGRFTYGVTDMYQDNNNFDFGGAGTFTDLEGKNAVIQIGVGYRL